MTRALLLLLVLSACGTAPTTSPEPAAAPTAGSAATTDAGPDAAASAADTTDGRTCDWRLEKGRLVHPFVEDREPVEPTEVDLDGEPPPDLIGVLGGCGNWGDCEHVVLRACDGGGYEAVWGPDYAQGLRVGERPEGAELAKLVKYDRTATAGCDLPLTTTLTWTGDGWEEGRTCSGKGVWDDAICGERPPPCE